MSNLLPEEQKKILRQAYFFRVATISLFALFACLLVALAGLLPAHFATFFEAKTIEEKADGLQNFASEKNEGELLMAQMKDLNAKLEMLEKWSTEALAHKDIFKVIDERGKGIAITTLAYHRGNGSVIVSGVASTRDTLLGFKTALEESGKFKTVDLPVSNLAQKEDIDFSITISFAKL